MKVMITGASGFIGSHLVPLLAERGHAVRIASRRRPEAALEIVPIESIGGRTDWQAALDGIDTVVHLAGVAHRPVPGIEAEARIHEVNVEATARLAGEARRAGVRSFIFLSSV
ncbi:MAG TPA: NAD-dependent epimerase/dehydratase family protein, partial [Thermoanaerobaculia bacterium]|nr:NAD-dependent epimerase/dehydratase family protein [Thermoanaerobaculia bacterium]